MSRPKGTAAAPRRPAVGALNTMLKQKPGRPFQGNTDLPEPIMGMLTRLPQNGNGWTQERRDKFLFTFGTVLDFCFPIVTAEEITEGSPDEETDAV